MKKGSVSLVTLLLAAIIVAGGYYFLIYGPRHQEVSVATAPAKQDLASPDATGTSTTLAPTVDETEIIKAAVKAAIIAKRGASAGELTYTVSKIDGNYAKGGASGQGGGAMWFAAKTGGKWTLVWDGNGVILCSDLTAYPEFPNTMIPECYNDLTKKTVTR